MKSLNPQNQDISIVMNEFFAPGCGKDNCEFFQAEVEKIKNYANEYDAIYLDKGVLSQSIKAKKRFCLCKNEENTIYTTKMKGLYEKHFVKSHWYSELKSNYFCPICEQPRDISQLEIDHFLPKSKAPTLSIYSKNLVPICRDCNKEKKEKILDLFHPYFDSALPASQWLQVLIEKNYDTRSIVFVYTVHFASAGIPLSDLEKNKIRNSFDICKLQNTYSLLASQEVLEQIDIWKREYKIRPLEFREKMRFLSENPKVLAWKSALYKAIALVSDEFFDFYS